MVARILIGKFPDGGKGLRISEPGYGVRANPVDNERLWFNSDWPASMPIHYTGAFTVANTAQVTQGYTDLGYIPFADVMVEANVTYNQFAPAGSIGPYELSYTYISLFSGGTAINPFLQVTFFHNYLLIRNYSTVAVTVYVTVYRVMAFPS